MCIFGRTIGVATPVLMIEAFEAVVERSDPFGGSPLEVCELSHLLAG